MPSTQSREGCALGSLMMKKMRVYQTAEGLAWVEVQDLVVAQTIDLAKAGTKPILLHRSILYQSRKETESLIFNNSLNITMEDQCTMKNNFRIRPCRLVVSQEQTTTPKSLMHLINSKTEWKMTRQLLWSTRCETLKDSI